MANKVEMVNKVDFVRMVADASDKLLTQREVNACLECMTKVVTDIMKEQRGVKIGNIVTVFGQLRPACEKRNPATGEMVSVPEKVAPKAKFGKGIKDALNA